ncbi:MAG: Signal transduction histidine kinase, partial [Bacteroidota bacterium]
MPTSNNIIQEIDNSTLDDLSKEDLIKLFGEMKSRHKKELDDIRYYASFPNENPFPVLRTDLSGKIIFKNRQAKKLDIITVEGVEYQIQDFLYSILNDVPQKKNFEIEICFKNNYYNFIFCPILNEGYYNIYASDISEKKQSEIIAKENFERLNSFLESTDDAYYIVYQKNKLKNYFTSRW